MENEKSAVLIDTATGKVYEIGKPMEGGALLTERYARTLSGKKNNNRFRLGVPVDAAKEKANRVKQLMANLSPEEMETLKAALLASGIKETAKPKPAKPEPEPIETTDDTEPGEPEPTETTEKAETTETADAEPEKPKRRGRGRAKTKK